MAEKLIGVEKKGGGELKETVLWTNSSPTSTFASSTVTLSEDIDNYDYIAFYWRVSTSNADATSLIYSVDELKKTGTSDLRIGMASMPTGGSTSARTVRYVSDTSVAISTCYGLNTTATYNANAIPTKICGLK